MNILGVHFHNWKVIKQKYISEFMRERIVRTSDTNYKVCIECGVVAEYFYDSQGGHWAKTLDREREIITNKIYEEEDGEYFFRKVNDYTIFTPPAAKKLEEDEILNMYKEPKKESIFTNQPTRCINCKSDRIQEYKITKSTDIITSYVKCSCCAEKWKEEYCFDKVLQEPKITVEQKDKEK